MAIQISKTVGEYFSYSNYRSCPAIYAYLDATYPGWTEETSIDVLEWSEGLRAIGEAGNVNYGFYRALNSNQMDQFIPWALAGLIAVAPVGYTRLSELLNLKSDIESYISDPSPAKEASLASSAMSIRPEPGSHAETYIANAFKSIAAALASGSVTGEVIGALGFSLVKASRFLAGADQTDTHNSILTKLQQIIGVID